MAAYDSPGYPDRTPAGPLDARAMAGPGTQGVTAGMSAAHLATVGVSPGNLPDSPLAAPRDQVPQSVGETSGMASDNPYGQDRREDLTGVQLDYGGDGRFQPGSGSAGHMRHPNSHGAGP